MQSQILGVLCVVSLLTAISSLGFCAWMIARVYTSHLPTTIAATIAKQIDDSVRSRVKVMNDIIGGRRSENIESIEEAPVPSFFQSGSVDELHEINRELKRYKNADYDRAATIRDLGIGVEEA